MAGSAEGRHRRNAASSVCRWPQRRVRPPWFHGWPPSHRFDTFCSFAFYLHKIASLQPHRELRFGQRQDELRGFLELFFLIVIDVRPMALGEPVHEECVVSAPEEDDGPVSFRSTLPRPGDPLFDDPTTKVGVDLATFRPSNSLKQDRIRNPFLPGKALKPPGFVGSHSALFIL